ncbi:MAG: NAD(P)H-dependent oxidoreductase subunit E, partial [Actinomycetota bacterium]|nr:NAD(P)H-dependent oxidoreductase subunit E [Actinomycetota bacterium]
MDLRLGVPAPATEQERAAVTSVLGPAASGWDGGDRTAADGHMAVGGRAVREQRHLLLPVLHAVQERIGWISPGALDHICARLTIPPAEAYGVASFYALFRTEPSPAAVVHVCDDVACRADGAERTCQEMERRFGPEGQGAAANGSGVTWQRSPCLGQCDHGSAALIQHAGADPARVVLAPFDPEQVRAALAPGAGVTSGGTAVPQAAGDRSGLRLLRRVGQVEPGSIDAYRSAGGYEMLRRAVAAGPQGVLRELKDAKLVGRGGAAFPTGVKWEAVATNPVREHFVVCNADESEPGTFKDRVLMEQDPFALIEA